MHARVVRVALLLALIHALIPNATEAQQDDQPVFRAGVDLVTVAAVVRDKRGRVVQGLGKEDFMLAEGGRLRPIVDFESDTNGPVSVALLLDGSGSMRQAAAESRRVGETLFHLLDAKGDEAALMAFDTRLLTLREFTGDFAQLRRGLGEVDSFGATSVYDAIAGAAGIVDGHTRQRRALIVVTDGSDNWSSYSPSTVAWIASTIDVPVYVLAMTPAAGASDSQAIGGELGDVARATGGEYFNAGTDAQQARALGHIVEDLRHQYLIAFEPSPDGGLRPLEIKTRKPSLRVRARQWYSGESD